MVFSEIDLLELKCEICLLWKELLLCVLGGATWFLELRTLVNVKLNCSSITLSIFRQNSYWDTCICRVVLSVWSSLLVEGLTKSEPLPYWFWLASSGEEISV